jgi:chaperonin GroEL (HSP60 family)
VSPWRGVAALTLCLGWATSWLCEPSCTIAARVSWSRTHDVLAFTRSMLSSKASAMLSDDDCDALSTVVLRAFLCIVGDGSGDPCQRVRMHGVCGPPCASSELLGDSIVIDAVVPLLYGDEFRVEQCCVLLLDVNVCIDAEGLEGLATASAPSSSASSSTAAVVAPWSISAVERERLSAFADQVVRLGVGVVACQKVIHPWLQLRLRDLGVVALERLSVWHVGAMQAVSGAASLSAWDRPLSEATLGCVSHLRITQLHGRRVIVVQGACSQPSRRVPAAVCTAAAARARPVCTLVLCAPSQLCMSEVESCVKVRVARVAHVVRVRSSVCAFHVCVCVSVRASICLTACSVLLCLQSTLTGLALLMRAPVVVPGGGCTELHLAALVRHRASTWSGDRDRDGGPHAAVSVAGVRLVCGAFAAALEAVTRALFSQSLGSADGRSAVARTYRRNRRGWLRCHNGTARRVRLYGWDAVAQRPRAVVSFDAAAASPGTAARVDYSSAMAPCVPTSALGGSLPPSADEHVEARGGGAASGAAASLRRDRSRDASDGAGHSDGDSDSDSESDSDSDTGGDSDDVEVGLRRRLRMAVVDSVQVKCSALRHAIDAAVAVLRIESTTWPAE